MAAEVFPVARIDEYAKPCKPAIHVLRSVSVSQLAFNFLLKDVILFIFGTHVQKERLFEKKKNHTLYSSYLLWCNFFIMYYWYFTIKYF